jgi:predicted O-methyltransferase YrrM
MKDFKFDRSVIYPKDPTASEERIRQYAEYYKIKYQLCKEKNPSKIAEIGVRAGYSAWTFLQAAPKAKYYGFDANNGSHGGQGGKDGRYFRWAKEILKDYDIKLIEKDTQKEEDLNISDIDFFHVDGDHTTNGVKHDLDLAFKAINDNGLILIDDITYIPEVKLGVDQWIEMNKDVVMNKFVHSLRGEMLIWKK